MEEKHLMDCLYKRCQDCRYWRLHSPREGNESDIGWCIIWSNDTFAPYNCHLFEFQRPWERVAQQEVRQRLINVVDR